MTETPAWRIEVASNAARDLRKLDPPVRRRIVAAIDRLTAEPPTGDIRQLAGRAELRLRVGDWRVLFTRDATVRVVLVRRVLPRGRAYDR